MGMTTSSLYADMKPNSPTPVEISVELLEKTIEKRSTEKLRNQIASLDAEELGKWLDTDAKKKTFWINVYNSYVIILLRDKPELFEDRSSFFTEKRVTIAGNKFSFDDIEHGFIRRSKVKLSLGILNNPFPGSLEKMYRVDKVDPRIHFALNCGAAACPPVRVYRLQSIDKQLDESAREYLTATTEYSPEEKKVKVTALMSWFRGDFGGKSGALKMLKSYEVLPKDCKPEMEFLPYDWTLDIDNFVKS